MNAQRFLKALALAMLAIAMLAAPALAATDMAVVASAPAANEAAAPSSGRYWVQFANNVAAVEENTACISLQTADGEDVPSDKYAVSLPDPELEFVYRQYAWIDVEDLDQGTSYVIHISGDTTAKNGNKLGADVDIPFTVAAADQEPATLAGPSAVEGGTGSGDGNGGGSASSDPTTGTPWQVFALFGLMAVAIVAALIIKARRYQK